MVTLPTKPIRQIIKQWVVPQPPLSDPETWREFIRYN